MLQIAIWGIALLLLVTGLDVAHRQSVAKAAGNAPSGGFSTFVLVISIVGAVFIVGAARVVEVDFIQQSRSGMLTPNFPSSLDSATDEAMMAAVNEADRIEAEASQSNAGRR
jgi:hypothetical protein